MYLSFFVNTPTISLEASQTFITNTYACMKDKLLATFETYFFLAVD